MESVYKICVLGKAGDVKEIVVFSSEKEDASESPFHEKERAFIESNSIPVRFSKIAIHPDDSIFTIKHKLLSFISKEGEPRSYHELYFFSHIQKFNLQVILENLLEKSGSISADEYKQLLVNLNVKYNVLTKIGKDKETYTLEDMTELTEILHDKSRYYKTPLGKRFRTTHNELFSANPFDMLSIPEKQALWIQSSTNPLESFEYQLLLNNYGGHFEDNTIYACFAEDVLDYCESAGISQEWATALYFPLLIKEDITSQEALESNHRKLISATKKQAPANNDIIDFLYDIHEKKLGEWSYLERGVGEFSIILHPEFKHILPLDVIFKNVHATLDIPFIKYNPGPRRENIYRLYSESVTKYGTKIPYLSPKTIIKLAKETGRNKQISFSVEHSKGDFYLHVFGNGDISISGNNFREPMTVEQLNTLLQEVANPVIDHMNDFLKKNGYELQRFDNLHQSQIEIEFLHVVLKTSWKKELDWEKARPFFLAVFDGDEPDLDKGAEFRYKRVENYSVMNEEDAFIAGLFGHPRQEIVRLIAEKYDLETPEAAIRLAKFLTDHDQQHGRFVRTSMKIADSPGFTVGMRIESYESAFVCDLYLDNSIADVWLEYMDVFFVYMDALLRLTQDPKSTGVKTAAITKMGAKKVSAPATKEAAFGRVLTGIETKYLYDTSTTFAEDEELEVSAFGDLEQYESADIEPDVLEDFEKELEEAPQTETLSSLVEEEPELSPSPSPSGSQQPSLQEEQKDSISSLVEEEASLPSVSEQKEPIPSLEEDEDEDTNSESSDANSLMYMPEEDEEEDVKGGAHKLDGMLLKEGTNNIFLSKLKKREPTLFLSEDTGNFSAYSKICPANRARQPIILTPKEKEEIDAADKKNGSKSYAHALEYGSDPENKNYYICPRYWCLKTNQPISDKDAKAGKVCGKILERGAKTVKPGHYVVEFNHPEQHFDKDKPDNYFENSPGYLEGKLHPKGACMPCCFKKAWDSKAQITRRKSCEERGPDEEEAPAATKKKGKVKQDTYIMDIRRYPLPPKRWGYMPISVQYFLQSDNSKAADPHNNKYLKPDQTTLLRYGVENSTKKSFVACIADIYAYKTNSVETPSIEVMCDILASVVSIDLFLKYHNGSLAAIFRPKVVDIDAIDYNIYESAEFQKKLDKGNETHMDFINDSIAAYENFRAFLKNPDSYIDHTYLWDIICSPNPLLFPNGCNLAILRIRQVDMTDDIELLCPTSVYSPVLFDVRKETIIILQHDEFFEPIYLFRSKANTPTTIQKTFVENRSPIQEVLQIIRNSIQNYCSPKSSMPTTYKFQRSPPAETLLLLLLENKFTPRAQVLNYQGKVVGITVVYKAGAVYIPCFPSTLLDELPAVFMDDDNLWMNYQDTVDVLHKVYERSQGKILSRPVFKIEEDGYVVGVLTETNQFIKLSEPAEPIEDEIPLLRDEDYLVADKVMAQTKTEDPDRTQTIRKIQLETQFYSAFRTTVRILMNDPANGVYKQQITKLVESKATVKPREAIETLLHALCDPFVAFREYDDDALDKLQEISDCFMSPETKSYCVLNNGKYQLLLPKYHLVSRQPNDVIYYARIADELARYKRIQLFMMNAKTYLNLTNTEYKINPTEMLLLESLLTPDYLKSLEPYQHGNTLITYETANPILTQKYGNEISQQTQREMVTKNTSFKDVEDRLQVECVKSTTAIVGKRTTSEWKRFFSANSMEMSLHKTVRCSYYPIIYAYKQVKGTFMTVEEIRERLVQEYGKYGQYYEKVLKILRNQGKRDMVDNIIKGKYTLEEAIVMEAYALTTLDLWVLASGLRLPLVIFHQKKLKHLVDTTNWLRLAEGKNYIFVRVPTGGDSPSNYLPEYSIIKPALSATDPAFLELMTKKAMTESLNTFFENLE